MSVCSGSPSERKNWLFSKLCGMKDGFQVFYCCLRESQSDHSGHRHAADTLEARGEVRGLYPVYVYYMGIW